MDLDLKRQKEKEIVTLMIELYCRGNKHTSDKSICQDCQELIDYANYRVDLCPFMETKTFCENCKVHCYKADMREKIRVVMRYSGPKMIFHHPILAIKHVFASRQERKKQEAEALAEQTNEQKKT